MDFEIIVEITNRKPIAIKHSIRELARLQRQYGEGRWRKLKGITRVRLKDSSVHKAEVHWYVRGLLWRSTWHRSKRI